MWPQVTPRPSYLKSNAKAFWHHHAASERLCWGPTKCLSVGGVWTKGRYGSYPPGWEARQNPGEVSFPVHPKRPLSSLSKGRRSYKQKKPLAGRQSLLNFSIHRTKCSAGASEALNPRVKWTCWVSKANQAENVPTLIKRFKARRWNTILPLPLLRSKRPASNNLHPVRNPLVT